MDKAKRDAVIVKEREEHKTPFHVLGDRFGITSSRVHQIYHDKRDIFYSRLPEGSKSNRIKRGRVVLTKSQVAERLNIPEKKLELHV